MNKAKIDKKQVKNLLTLLEKGSATEKQALLTFMERHIIPFHLCQLEGSRDKLIQKYTKTRTKKLYTVKNSFDQEFAKRLGVSLEDLEEWGETHDKEISYYKKSAEKAINQVSEDDFDHTTAIELIRHNINLGLTSPYAYIRSLAEFMVAKKG